MSYANILLPVDLSDPETQKRAFSVAFDLAQRDGAGLHVMTVVPDAHIVRRFFPPDFEETATAEARKELEAFVADVAPDEAGEIDMTVVFGSIHQEILRCADETESDLIVMASPHRPTLRDTMVSPHAAYIVSHAHQSVLVVRS